MTKIEHIISVLTWDNGAYNGLDAFDMAEIFENHDYFADLPVDDYKAISKYVADNRSLEIQELRDHLLDVWDNDHEFVEAVANGKDWAFIELKASGFLYNPTRREQVEILRIVGRGGPLKEARNNLVELIEILIADGVL